MLFAAVPLAILATKSRLEEQLMPTLTLIAASLSVAQTVRAVANGADAWSAALMTVLSLLLTPAVMGVFILMGAPVSVLLDKTVLGSLVLSLLAVQPLLVEIGVDSGSWKAAVTGTRSWTDVYAGSVGTVVGAWVGAYPIALDWDRPWQAWPITIVLGASAGCGLGMILGWLVNGSAELKQETSTPNPVMRRKIPTKSSTTSKTH